jgi:hypothetical protein
VLDLNSSWIIVLQILVLINHLYINTLENPICILQIGTPGPTCVQHVTNKRMLVKVIHFSPIWEYCLENATDVVCNPKGSVEERISVLEYFIVLGCRIRVACTRRGIVRICNYDAC